MRRLCRGLHRGAAAAAQEISLFFAEEHCGQSADDVELAFHDGAARAFGRAQFLDDLFIVAPQLVADVLLRLFLRRAERGGDRPSSDSP